MRCNWAQQVIGLVLLLVACGAPPSARGPAPNSRLSVGLEAFVDDGPFRVVFAGPKGESGPTRDVTLAFSRPLRAAGVLEIGLVAATVTRLHDGARVEGTWRWFGERTAVFWPKDGFGDAAEYEVAVDSSLHALDGSALAAFAPFRFVTERPALSEVAYQWDEETDRHVIALEFNQAPTLESLPAVLRVEGTGPNGIVTVPIEIAATDLETRFEIVAAPVINSLRDVTVVASAQLSSTYGPLPRGNEQRLSVPDVGPQTITLSCLGPDGAEESSSSVRCSLERGTVSLRFSKNVVGTELARHLEIWTGSTESVRPPPAKGRSNALRKSRLRLKPGVLDDQLQAEFDLDQGVGLEPGKQYKILLKAGLSATDHERLTADRVLQFVTVDLESMLSLRDAEGDPVVEAARPAVRFAVESMNLARFEAVRAPLDETQLLELLAAQTRTTAWVRTLPGAVSDVITIRGQRNRFASASFDLPSAMRESKAPGLFAIATSATGLADEVRIVSVTDLGLTTKWSPYGGVVWVTHLSSGAPVGNASVSVRQRGQEVFVVATNEDGVAVIPPEVAARFAQDGSEPALLVRAAGDFAFAVVDRKNEREPQPLGLLFSERSLYRPGETAFIKGLFRFPGPLGLAPKPGQKMEIEAFDDAQRVLFSKTVELDVFGALSCEVPIARDVSLGAVGVRARLATTRETAPLGVNTEHRRRGRQRSLAVVPARRIGSNWAAHTWFHVDEFRSAEMKLEVDALAEEYVAGDHAKLKLRGQYLFGAPMHDAFVSLQVGRSPAMFSPSALQGYTTNGVMFWQLNSSGTIHGENVALDKAGAASPSIPLLLPGQRGPELVTVYAGISDVTGSFTVGDDASVLVHPAEIYVGVRLASKQPPWVGKPITVEVAAAPWHGDESWGVPVHVALYFNKNRFEQGLPTGHTCELITSAAGAKCELPVTAEGTYWVTAEAKDKHGRVASAADMFEVQLEQPPPRIEPRYEPPPPEPKPLPFDVACGKPESTGRWGMIWVDDDTWARKFLVGERAHVCLRGKGSALLTHEREGVLDYEKLLLRGPGALRDLPVTQLHHPNVDLGLHIVAGRTRPFPSLGKEDTGHPRYESGEQEVRVAKPGEQALSVELELGKMHTPGESFDAVVRVRDGDGRPAVAQVTLWAVDQGVLELEHYRLPTPSERFSDERSSAVNTNDTRQNLLWERGGLTHSVQSPKIRMGGTTVGERSHIGRAVFRPTAWFIPNLVTDIDGDAKVRVTLPDNLTTWKVFAVAANTLSGFGEAETEFVTQQPLMLRPQLPRFLRAGDRFDATVVVDSMLKRTLEVELSMQLSGAVRGNGKTTQSVPGNGHVPVSFAVEAVGQGKARMRFSATVQRRLADEVTIEEEVSVPTTVESIVLSGETRGHVNEPLGDLRLARADVGGLEYRFASTPLVGLAESLQGLVDYPYGCTEQLSSRLVPLVTLRGLAQRFSVALPSDVDEAVRDAVANLLGHQLRDGGFGFWRESVASEPVVTIGALSALYASRQAGFAVPQRALDRALRWLDGLPDAEKTEPTQALETPLMLEPAFAVMLEDVFASLGQPREAKLRALATAPDLPRFARAQLGHALAKVDAALAKQVLDGVASQLTLSGATATLLDEQVLPGRSYLSSSGRTTALLLRAFVAVAPADPLVPKLVRGLLGLRRAGRWSTTQETAWALIALRDYEARLHATQPAGAALAASSRALHLSFAGNVVAQVRGVSVAQGMIPMAKLAAAPGGVLSFSAQDAPLFYEATLRYSRKSPPSTPLEHGIHVARSLTVVRKGEPVSATELRVGDVVVVDVVLGTVVPRDLVVLEDPIPAGFEAVNTRFANVERDVPTYHDSVVTHRELRDDRVLSFYDQLPAGLTHARYPLRVIAAGRFAHPPAKAEGMYTPDVFGRTAASVVETR